MKNKYLHFYLMLEVLFFLGTGIAESELPIFVCPIVYCLYPHQRTNVRARLPENVQLPAAAVSFQRGRGLGGGRGHTPPALQPLSNNK